MTKPRHPIDLVDFLEAVSGFGYDELSTPESRDQPHKLQVATNGRDNYLWRLCSAYDDIHEYVEYSDHPEYVEYAGHPDVTAFISSKGAETAEAFSTLFSLCEKFRKSVHDMAVDPGEIKKVSVEKNGISDAEAEDLRLALEKIWQAVPDTDPRLLEGMEYVMSLNPAIGSIFFGSGWFQWKQNRHRSDYQIADKLENWNPTPSPEAAAAIMRQSADNLAALKPFAKEIAAHMLAWCLSRTLKIDEDYRFLNPSRDVARGILDRLGGGATIEEVARDIRKGAYGKLRGRKWIKDDRIRKCARGAAVAAPLFLAVAADVASGAWFDREGEKLRALAKDAVSSVYTLQAPLKVHVPIKLGKRRI